jgi:aryl-alcohol dehydrogenase-like predicted oxidoreductase
MIVLRVGTCRCTLSPTEGNNLHDSIPGCVCAVASGAGFVRITSAKDEMMEYVTLGKTGLRVSVAGLGCGGNSRLGLGRGKTEAEAIALVRQALDLGLNLLDTAAAYGTEALIGKAIKPVPRDHVVITTKALINRGSTPIPPVRVVESLERSLRQLDTDYIDVLQLHVVPPAMYDHAFQTIASVLLREKEKGKFRALGITETSPNDHEQLMLQRAVHDAVWDVVMLGFNMMHHNARTQIFPHTIANNIGTLLMFVVRNIFSQPGRLTAKMQELAATGQVPQWLADTDNPLGFLIHEGGASSVMDAAYRFVRHEPGVHVTLFGTSEPEHLRANIASLLKPPLPEADRQQLAALFGHLLGVGLEPPDPTTA